MLSVFENDEQGKSNNMFNRQPSVNFAELFLHEHHVSYAIAIRVYIINDNRIEKKILFLCKLHFISVEQ